MKKIIFTASIPLLIFLIFSCKDNSTDPYNDNDSTYVGDRKPNLYIYPEQTLSLSVKINFPNGGKVTESIPAYNNSWNITVTPNGQINDYYDYLFYECDVPDLTQKEYGWVIKTTELENFFANNLSLSGFSQKEVNDFIEYWIPLLTEHNYYAIYPQYKTQLNKMIEIEFSEIPDNFYRLHYVIIGRDNNKQLPAPQIESAIREKYYAVEWGVILK